MTLVRHLIRILAIAGIMALAACGTTQTQSTKTDVTTGVEQAAEQAQAAPEEVVSEPQQGEDGAPVAVFLADMIKHDGWHEVQLEEGSIFLNPEAVVVREDLTGVQAGASAQGDGLVALELGPVGRDRIKKTTTDNPNMRLAFIVGQTLIAAPGFAAPIDTEQLIFIVGTEQNAISIARAIAGVPDDAPADSME